MIIVVFAVASAHLVLRAGESPVTDTYTLVQYIGSVLCNSEGKACHSGLGTAGFSHLPHKDATICAKLHEHEGVFEVDACSATGDSCPAETCGDCKGFFHSGLVLDQCKDGYMLVRGNVEGCVESDVALGRWCNKVPSDGKVKETGNATEAEGGSLLTLASMYQNQPLPSQGFEGSNVEHKNYKTATDDWRTEYGPRSQKTSSCHSLCNLSALLLILLY
eukprot:GEMP01079523.1.p1 GENE.GEMP01079523.1~~GEMP01079523.1.p1  ORF type:complete len:219 (+),score=32.27 GEMP01079523.1:45-701(+)